MSLLLLLRAWSGETSVYGGDANGNDDVPSTSPAPGASAPLFLISAMASEMRESTKHPASRIARHVSACAAEPRYNITWVGECEWNECDCRVFVTVICHNQLGGGGERERGESE